MGFSLFEVIMLVCFGLGWPFSIYRTYKATNREAKSLVFLVLVLIGYVSGIIHKLVYKPDIVIALYALNTLMVAGEMILVIRNRRIMRRQKSEDRSQRSEV